MGNYLTSSDQPAGSMPGSGIRRAYEEVVSLLQLLDVILFCLHRDFGSEIKRFYWSFKTRDIRCAYGQFQLWESRLADPSDNPLITGFSIQIADAAREAREYVVSEVLRRHGRELLGRNMYQLETSTTSLADDYTSTVMNKLLGISMEDEHFFLYDLVVSLLYDLELILSSHWHTSDSEPRFRKEDIQIMYDNLNMMDSLLIDSSGQGYDIKLISSVENWVRFVACRCRDYIHMWPQSSIGERSTGSPPPSPPSYMLEDPLQKINKRLMEDLSWETMHLTEKQKQRNDSFLHTFKLIWEPYQTSSAGKKLGVFENEEDYGLHGWLKNLIHLQELQTLKYIFRDPFAGLKPDRLPSQNFVLAKLINLTVSGTAFPWEDMGKLCALPKLEVLKLKNYAFIGPTWTLEPEAGGFPCLKYLLIGTTNLQTWEADDTHFPKLQHLVLMKCRRLKEIPCGIFQALLLERIELHDCSETTVISAEELQQELVENGNDGLVLHVTPNCR